MSRKDIRKEFYNDVRREHFLCFKGMLVGLRGTSNFNTNLGIGLTRVV